MRFEWHLDKAVSNLKKHGVSFQEASTVFSDLLAYTFDDPDHADEEYRLLTIGMSTSGRLLVVSYVERGGDIRIISARRLTKREQQFYQEGA